MMRCLMRYQRRRNPGFFQAFGIGAALALGLTACQQEPAVTSPPALISASEHRNLTQCGDNAAGVSLLTAQAVEQLTGRQFLGTEPGAKPAPLTTDRLPASGEHWLLLISHGPQPSAGYHFRLEGAQVNNGIAEISVNWVTPAPDSLQATVMTNPCLVVKLAKGDYRKVLVTDQSTTIGELAVPAVAGR